MAVIWSALTNIFLYLTMQNALKDSESNKRNKIAFATVVFYNLTIFAHLYAVTMVPDTSLVFFWLLVIFFVQKFTESRAPVNLYLAGFSLGFGLLSKYTAIAILPAIFLIFLLDPSLRRMLLKPYPYLTLLLALIVFAPVIIWNVNHDWMSLKFQFADRSEELKPFQTKYVFQLIASQLFMLTPLPVVMFFKTSKNVLVSWKQNTPERYFFITGIFIIGGFIALSLKTLIKMNWLLPGFMGMILSTVLLYYREDLLKSRWIKSGIIVSIALVMIAYSILLIPNIPLGDGNTWSGWKKTSAEIAILQEERGGQDHVFIFANSYKTASLLKFYLADDQDVYAQNIYDHPALQFDVWGLPASLKGKDALFVFTDRREYHPDLDKIGDYFDEITLVTKNEYMFNSKLKARTLFCYYAKNYKGAGSE